MLQLLVSETKCFVGGLKLLIRKVVLLVSEAKCFVRRLKLAVR